MKTDIAQDRDTTRGAEPSSQTVEHERGWAERQRLHQAFGAVHSSCPDIAVLAIPWLHLIHAAEPVHHLVLSEAHSSAGWSVGEWVRLMVETVTCFLYACYLSIRQACLRIMLRREICQLRHQPFAFVAKTWSYAVEHIAGDHDFYYGDLQCRLDARGLRMLILYGGQRVMSWRVLRQTRGAFVKNRRLPEWCLVSPWAPFAMMVRQLRASRHLRRLMVRTPDPLVQAVSRRASHACLSREAARNGLLFWIGRTAVQWWRPRVFMTLYEGHAWEKCAWWGAKTADATCRTVGYQHTVVFREALSLTQPSVDIRERSLPDVVLCLGEETRRLLAEGHAPSGVPVLRFGSLRSQPRRAKTVASPTRRTVLVTPEGLAEEVFALFHFALACARRLPTHRFILRCHPGFPIAQALLAIPALRAQSNILVSAQPRLDEDVAQASLLLYRGSSSVLSAILHGVLPVYVHVDAMREVDPLHALSSWRRRCATVDEFAAALERHERTPLECLETEWTVAAQYVEAYLEPVDENTVDQFLQQTGGRTTVTAR